MLKLKLLPRVLEQANTGGVHGCMFVHFFISLLKISTLIFFFLIFRLVNAEGSILASSGENPSQNKAIAAIASNIWNSFQQPHMQDEELNYLLLECEVCRNS